jgi:hypothetical protein
MFISKNGRFRQETNADQRHGSFSAHIQLVLAEPNQNPHFGRKNKNYPASVFTETNVSKQGLE